MRSPGPSNSAASESTTPTPRRRPGRAAPPPEIHARETRRGARVRPARVAAFEALLDAEDRRLLSHQYFQLCAGKLIDRGHAIRIVKQMHCFSVCFERLITGRVARYSREMDPRILELARRHL